MADLGFPVHIPMLRAMAILILKSKNSLTIVIGEGWYTRFLNRHPVIEFRYVQYLERAQASKSANAEVRKIFYGKLKGMICQYNIRPENLWNCDEKGITI